MAYITSEAPGRAYRLYDLDLPYRVPGFSIGFAISNLKQIGVWESLPRGLRDKAQAAKASWSALKLTQKDLDSIPDDAWQTIARTLGVRWRYADGPAGAGLGLAAEPVQENEVVN